MADITMTNGNRYTFSNSSGNAVLQHSTDHVGEPTYFNNQVIIGTNTDSGQTDTPSLKIESWNTTNTLGPSIYCRNVQGGDVGIAFDANGTDFVIGIDAGETDRLMIGSSTTPSATDGNNICEIKARHEDTTADDHIIMDLNPDGDGKHSIGKIRASRAGFCGSYESGGSYMQQIWSMGYQYSPDFSGNSEKGTWGDLYGLGYFHTNSGLSYVTSGAHQIAFVGAGVQVAGISLSNGNSNWGGDMELAADKDLILNSSDSGQIRILGVASSTNRDAITIGIDGEYVGYIKWYDDDDATDQRCYIGYNTSNNRLNIQQYNPAGSGTWPVFYVSQTGTIYSTGAHSTSDNRLKENIRTITGSLDVVKQLRGVAYTWNSIAPLSGSNDYGLIAQEVETILPEIVSTDDETEENCQVTSDGEKIKPPVDNQKHLNYEHLAGHFVEAIKEQQVIIEDLKARIEALES